MESPSTADRLRARIAAAQAVDHLARVTVLVPSTYPGLFLRRRLAAMPGGVVNVRFVVLARVAELLGAPALAAAGRRPLPTAERTEAVRAGLLDDPGQFATVAHHPATARSLDRAVADITGLGDEQRRLLASRGRRPAQLVALARRVEQRLPGTATDHDVARAAAAAVRAGGRGTAELGLVIDVFPRAWRNAADRELVDALMATGRYETLLPWWEAAGRPGAGGAVEPAADRIVVAPDAETEVRLAVQAVADAAATGMPLDAMALVAATPAYLFLIHEHLDAAAIPHGGPPVSTLASSVSGRTLNRLLRLAATEFSAEAVSALLADGPIVASSNASGSGGDEPSPVPAERWEQTIRAARIVGGPAQWAERLAVGADGRRQSSDPDPDHDHDHDHDHAGNADRRRRDRAALSSFVATLVVDATPPPPPATWRDRARWASALLARYLPAHQSRRHWPGDEADAYERVATLIDGLGRLDRAAAGHRPTHETFLAAVDAVLATPARRIGAAGHGVFVGRLPDVAAASFTRLWILGMAEGCRPVRRRDDPVLPDRDRRDLLPTRRDRGDEERTAYLLALDAGHETTISFARTDMRAEQERMPSRWLLESGARLAGAAHLRASTLLRYRNADGWIRRHPSLEQVLGQRLPSGGAPRSALAPSAQEARLARLLTGRLLDRPLLDLEVVAEHPDLARGLWMLADRRSDRLGVHDGVVGPLDGLVDLGRPLSPTSLERWAECPTRYLFSHVLGVRATERPEESLEMTALDRGSLVHALLERFLDSVPARTSPDDGWSEDEHALLAAMADDAWSRAEVEGRATRTLLGANQRRLLRARLRTVLARDASRRAVEGVVPRLVEIGFGADVEGSLGVVEVETPSGRRVRFRGRIDRIDAAPDDSRVSVLDYKTGKGRKYELKAMGEDPLLAGQALQLPIYGLAAKRRPGWDAAAISAAYVMLDTDAEPYRAVTLDANLEQRFGQVLDTIVGAIEAGRFPADPGDEGWKSPTHCTYCDFTRVCPADRMESRARKAADPGYAPLVSLAADGPSPDDIAEGPP